MAETAAHQKAEEMADFYYNQKRKRDGSPFWSKETLKHMVAGDKLTAAAYKRVTGEDYTEDA